MKKDYNYGFLVQNNTEFSKDFTDSYLEIRKRLFDYLETYPEARINIGKDTKTGVRKIRLKNAHLGLVLKYEEAVDLKEQLEEKFPDYELEIICIEYKDAEYIQWYTSDGIISSKEYYDSF